MPSPAPSGTSRSGIVPVALSPNPNVAILFYSSNTLLSMISFSFFQGSLHDLRCTILSMMLLVKEASFVFIQDKKIIDMENVPVCLCLP